MEKKTEHKNTVKMLLSVENESYMFVSGSSSQQIYIRIDIDSDVNPSNRFMLRILNWFFSRVFFSCVIFVARREI